MVGKGLKAQLFSLGLLTAMCLAYFFYENHFPDHALAISSDSQGLNFLRFYFFSAISLAGAFVGPWVIFPLTVFGALYAFVYSKRNDAMDLLIFPIILVFFLAWATLQFPDLVGPWPVAAINAALSSGELVALSCAAGLAWVWPTFRPRPRALWRKLKALCGPKAPARKRARPKPSPLPPPSYGDVMKGISYKRAPLLDAPQAQYFEDTKEALENKLRELSVDGKIINVLKGPVVDTFELELGEGVAISQVTKRQEDLSLALYGSPVRIVYPMKGKNTLGIEVPREPRGTMALGDVLESRDFLRFSGALPVAMGKNAFGVPLVRDLVAMPHMLVAGSTGAGKSVFMNSLIISLLARRSPQELKFILIDPKQLELSLYGGLPHLAMPVVTGPREAKLALLWACQEMEHRYELLKQQGVRNIESYNAHAKSPLPYLVIIVDEFADLILSKEGKDIETHTSRLAAKARASGIHLVVATQRPSVDVITGVIKSNFPTRISFKVSTGRDSSTILDHYGAEKLLGRGDALLKEGTETLRLHCPFVDEKEVEMITSFLSKMGPQFHQKALEFMQEGHLEGHGPQPMGQQDPLYGQAQDIVLESRVASASMLQRRLKIGYNRAANLVDQLEARGVVGPGQGARKREVYPPESP